MDQIIECVPNFSEGNQPETIRQITEVIQSVNQVRLIDVDAGQATNRTVVTFVGPPEAVCEAAFLAVRKAAQLIDMRKHQGAHPRFGATDVLPLVPVKGISMEETASLARQLAQRIGEELQIPVYCYENAALEEKRRNLADCRSGEYEGLSQKLSDPDWQPDFGPARFDEKVARSGATAVSARNFLVAYNINLNTTSTRWANAIAFDLREKGRVKREGGTLTGKPLKNNQGEPLFEPGLLKGVKGIGWYIEEYGIAQLSFNITDITRTTIHQTFEAACQRAEIRGLRVTGSQLVGVVPLQAMLDAGRYFLHKQKRSAGVSDEALIKIAVKSLGLDELGPFDPKKKIIEYLIEDKDARPLINSSVSQFVENTASESPAPGGGSVSACMGAMGAALGSMVANLSAHKRGWEAQWETFAQWAEKGKTFQDQLLRLVDEDTRAFNAILSAFQLPKSTDQEKQDRRTAIQKATRYAIEVPLKVMELSYQSMEVMKPWPKQVTLAPFPMPAWALLQPGRR
ncbi:glutamate formiminotransferase [Geofilum rubicundum JCM 15548]|uniref:Formimidoyltransferase-cyclodeaminase n=1 Tax=Geofilum rubicundum JCM 15548 TaxID=1236989 RepID=A0A0E9LVU0_9BACT|nr:glutamate formimidoyltransferase [Geofilum rubicundum]GAO29707.1 glutamate formiminotransferase [Geofilum rubicundum JCM 15548]